MRFLAGLCLSVLWVNTAMAAGDFTLSSPVLKENAMMPKLYTCDDKNTSPPLSWTNPPANTQAFALLMYSPDWPEEMVYKWVLFNIPADKTSFKEGQSDELPDEVVVVKNSFGDAIYRGPCAPDAKLHHYIFDLYALDKKLDLDNSAELEDVVTAIKHHAIKDTKFTVIYKH